MKSDTLHLNCALGKTLWLTIILLILLGGIAESITRLASFQAPLTPPKMGSGHYQLGHKLALLDAEVKRHGTVDCIMVGSSMVDVGFNPAFFRTGYHATVGRDIRCFNFGIDASSAASTAALAKILVEDYHPRILIIGTDAHDYAVPSSDKAAAVILDTPWVQYRQGNPSLDGWLLEHSYLYRYRKHLSRLLRLDFENTVWSETKLNFPILPNGFTPITKISTYINDPPDPDDTSYEVTYFTRTYSPFHLLDENLMALGGILQYHGSETGVIVVEMPVSDGLYYFFGNGEADYNRFIARVGEQANQHQIPFLRTEPLDFIPDNGWSDYSHLNVTGAELFSTWLGEQVGGLEVQKDAMFPSHNPDSTR